jgi:hypothetical protein
VAVEEDAGIIFRSDSITSDPQVLFEGAVLAVIARVLETGVRIDQAVSDYLARFPMEVGITYLSPDLIICASDCLRLVRHAAGTEGSARLVLDDATRAWRAADAAGRLSVNGHTTRIQACIGNIRRALGPMA